MDIFGKSVHVSKGDIVEISDFMDRIEQAEILAIFQRGAEAIIRFRYLSDAEGTEAHEMGGLLFKHRMRVAAAVKRQVEVDTVEL